MWHEARKQEKIVRKVIVDYRRRAERKHDYYDKIKQDPTKFMQVHGKNLKLIIDENNCSNDNSSHMVPWQGDKSNMIDRFDVRAHLDFIRDFTEPQQKESTISKEEKKLNYERYRILVYNEHKGVSESQHLHKIYINETYPELTTQKQEAEAKKLLLQSSKATIGFDYGEGSSGQVEEEAEDDDSDSSLEDDDEFLTELEDIPPLRDLTSSALQDMEKHSLNFGMGYTDFVKSLDLDQNMQLRMDAAKAIESEKLKMAGKKSRRERRSLKDQRLKDRIIGPLSYVQRDDSDKLSGSESESSKSDDDDDDRGKDNEGEIEFITSFGDNNGMDTEKTSQPAQSSVTTTVKSVNKEPKKSTRRSRSRSRDRRSRSYDRHRRSRSRSRGYSRSHRDSDSAYRRDYGSRRRRSSSRDRSNRRRSRSSDRWSRSRRSRSRDRRSRSRSSNRRRTRSRSRERRRSRSHERSPGKVATATLKSATPSKLALSTGATTKKLTPQEKLKIKMQRALKKQLKADKIAMADKRAQAFHEQLEREDELREMARKMRRREHERRDRDSPHRSRADYR